MRRALVLLTLVAVGCGPLWDGIGGSSDEIAEAVERGKRFRLAAVTDFDWDRFYVFGPYMSNDEVDRALGFDWGKAENSDYRLQDGGSLLVFVRDGEVVHAFDQPDRDGDFTCVGRAPLTPREAVLQVKGPAVFRAATGMSRSCPYD